MKPTVIASANSSATAGGGGGGVNATNGVNIPINHEYHHQHQPQHQQQPYQHMYSGVDPSGGSGPQAYGSPSSHSRLPPHPQHQPQQHQQPYASTPPQQQQQQHPQYQQQQPQPQQIPAHFQQGFGFEPDMGMDMDMDMFPRGRLGRMHDPFAGFGGSHFDFPQFGSMGRRRAAANPLADDHDFFNRLPSEFRQYIPDGFGHRRAGSGTMPQQQQPQSVPHAHGAPAPAPTAKGQYYPSYVPSGTTPPTNCAPMPQSPSKKLCDAAIQTEDLGERSEVDGAAPMHTDSLKQHGLRNTMDMGVKSAAENENHGPRSHSAPPPEQQQQHQQMPVNGTRPTPLPQAGNPQFGTQTSPPVVGGAQQPPLHKAYYAPQSQPHPQQKQQTPPPPQTPGGTYIRTIPIFVEGRSEPIINSHKEIPNQNGTAATASASASAKAYAPPPQQQQQQFYQQQPAPHQQPQQPSAPHHRPTPLNTQQQPQTDGGAANANAGLPPQTPHTLDSINKIQDIQRDVLDLMGKVENFGGRRQDKEYAYLDEMLTRNLLKLDTIDTNGKDSIRLARKEAIKCIQASINVLEAKAEENAKTAQAAAAAAAGQPSTVAAESDDAAQTAQRSTSKGEVTKETQAEVAENATKLQEPIPLPAPEGMQTGEPAGDAAAAAQSQREASPGAVNTSVETSEVQSTVESK